MLREEIATVGSSLTWSRKTIDREEILRVIKFKLNIFYFFAMLFELPLAKNWQYINSQNIHFMERERLARRPTQSAYHNHRHPQNTQKVLLLTHKAQKIFYTYTPPLPHISTQLSLSFPPHTPCPCQVTTPTPKSF